MFDAYLIGNANVFEATASGYVGKKFTEGVNLQLCIVFPDSGNFRVLHHIKNNEKVELQDALPASIKDGVVTYAIAMKVATVKNNDITYACLPHNNKNHVIVEITEGEVTRLFKVGVVSQKGRFFLLSREYYARQEFIDEMPENVGRVEWFDVFSGVGCLRIKDGSARIYWDRLVHPDIDEPNLADCALCELKPGDWVIFDKLSEPAEKRTGFKKEVSGSALISKDAPTGKVLVAALSWLETFSVPNSSGWAPKLGDIFKG